MEQKTELMRSVCDEVLERCSRDPNIDPKPTIESILPHVERLWLKNVLELEGSIAECRHLELSWNPNVQVDVWETQQKRTERVVLECMMDQRGTEATA